ncbi:hypothetical protein GCM10025865_08650 [Paraoerskovia sediminicola]|uniref:DUF2599 domain-containing protein n=1 Tax=Paraoerskovia sediminicola TaxID=1138587 RepID=A0ABM8G0N2_9CELL|nr:DUF2599 domain-containing protein [Paraoerskovia sediminicola]BDZ41566.1 hypothetical protein GCM10025865_08650 [Paraoerskovia sediminicola]
MVGGLDVTATGYDVAVEPTALTIRAAAETAPTPTDLPTDLPTDGGLETARPPSDTASAATATATPGAEGEPGDDGQAGDEVLVTLGADPLESATWGTAEGGRSLAVDPTEWARHAGVAGLDATWAAVVAAQPDADTPGMRDQLECHALGAPDKATWNLEPWRPDVGLVEVALARCNPV